jgi:hypothetical protein
MANDALPRALSKAALAILLAPLLLGRAARAEEGSLALEVARELAAAPRPSGGAACRDALVALERRLAAAGLAPRRHRFATVPHDGVTVLGVEHFSPGEARFTGDSGEDLWVAVAGRSPEVVLVSAHVDSDGPDVPGARDDAAGVGILLEAAVGAAARARREGPPARTRVFAIFEGEERGLLGSRAFAADAPAGRIACALSLDSIGETGLALNGLGPTVDRALASAALGAAREARVPVAAPLPHLLFSRVIPQAERSDHRAFAERGAPAFHLLARGEAGFDPCYHTPRDGPDRLERAPLGQAVRFLGAFLGRVDDALDRPAGDARFLPLAAPDPLGFGEATPVLVPGPIARALALGFGLAAVACLAALARRSRLGLRTLGRGAAAIVAGALGGGAFLVPFVLARALASAAVPWHASFERYAAAGAVCAAAAVALLAVSGRARRAASPAACAVTGAIALLALALALAWIGVAELAALPAAGAAALAAGALAERAPARAAAALLALPAIGLVLRPAIYREGVLTGTLPPVSAGWVVAALAVAGLFGPALGFAAHALGPGRRRGAVALGLALLAAGLTARALLSPAYREDFPENTSTAEVRPGEPPGLEVAADRDGAATRVRVGVDRGGLPVDWAVITYRAAGAARFAWSGGGEVARAAGAPFVVDVFGPGPIADERLVTPERPGAEVDVTVTLNLLEGARESPPTKTERHRAALVGWRAVH